MINRFIQFVFLFVPTFLFGQSKIDLRFLGDNEASYEFIRQNNLNTYVIFYEQFFVTDEKVDFKKLGNLLDKNFPSKSSSGFLVLDWEGKGLDVLSKQTDKKKFKKYKEEYIKALDFVKEERPNVKVGYYAIPFRQYWALDDAYISKNENLIDILIKQDFIAPSLYTFYIDKQSEKRNQEYIKKNVEFAIKVGKQLNKPIYPFIWHRVHPSNKNSGNKLVPIDIFRKSINDIISVNYEGRTVNGLFWWHSENYSFLTRKTSKIFTEEYKNINSVKHYQKNMYQSYYNSFKNIL